MFGIDSLISDSIEEFFRTLAESSINMFLLLLNEFNSIPSFVLDMPIVTSCILYAQGLAGSILVVKFVYEIWYNNVLRMNGESDADIPGTLFRAAQTAGIIGAIPWITKQVYVWGTGIAGDIANMPGTSVGDGGNMMDTLFTSLLINPTGSVVIVAGVLIFAIVVFLLVLVQNFVRAAELAVIAVVGSFMALGLTTTNSQSFSTWWKELFNVSMAQAIQLFLLKCSFYTLTFPINTNVPMLNLMVFAGFLWVTYKSPSILKQYTHSTGVGKVGGQATQQAGSMVMMRKMMTMGK
jgi:hypothetical protein